LPHPTTSTAELASYAQAALTAIFRFGYQYQKVGVMLTGLIPADFRQTNLFNDGPDDRQVRLARVVDKLNYRYGRDKIRLAAAGYDPSWHHKQQWMSKRYTTQWKDILNVK